MTSIPTERAVGGRTRVVALLTIGLIAPGGVSRPAEPTVAEEGAFRAAVERVAAAVVRIEPATVSEARSADGFGPSTGLVIDPDGLLLATEFAVPSGVSEVVVMTTAGDRRIALVKGRDRGRGVVLLQTDPMPKAPPLEPVPPGQLQPGQWAIAVGHGWPGAEPGVSVGIVSATDRCWGLAVQTDAAVSPMNYGGPLVDVAGRVIGLLVPLPADTAGMKRGSDLYDSGIGFAVPLTDLLRLVPRLRAGDVLEPGVLGLAWESRDSINGQPVIGAVLPGSPAAAAGLVAGDRIVRIAGRVVSRVADVRRAVTPLHAGDEVAIEVERSGGQPPPEQVVLNARLVDRLAPVRRGVLGVVAAADDEVTRISWLLPSGPAAAAGVAVGDEVLAIRPLPPGDGVPLQAPSPRAVVQMLAGLTPGRRVRLDVSRNEACLAFDIELIAPPNGVPDEGPPRPPAAGPLEDAIEPVKVTRLDAAESADEPLAVLPRAGGDPLAVLLHFGPPRGAVADDEAAAWRPAVAATGVAVILAGSADDRRWSRDDVPAVLRAIQSLAGRRRLDPDRIAVSGSGAGGAFAWLVAERLGVACRGVAVVDAPPPAATLAAAGPGETRWILLGASDGTAAWLGTARRRLEDAGHVVGDLTGAVDGAAATLCRWVSMLGVF